MKKEGIVMLKKRVAAIVSLALVMSLTIATPAFAKTSNSGSKKTVYAVSSWKTVSERIGEPNKIEKTAEISLVYTKSGLLRTIKTKDKKNRYPYLKGKPKYSYKGKRLIKVVHKVDHGVYTTTFKYKKGKLKSATKAWKSSEPGGTYYYVKNGKQVAEDYYDTDSRNHKLKLNSRGRVLHRKDVRYNDKGYPVSISEAGCKYTLDEHGFPVKSELVYTEELLKALGSAGMNVSHIRIGEKEERSADYIYDKNGRLEKAVVTYFDDGEPYYKETFTFNYKTIKIPSNYNTVFKTQQYDILFFFANPLELGSYEPESTPIGFGKVG